MALHNEIEFENELCEHLAENGWLYSKDDSGYDRERALFPEDLFGWLEDTQPAELGKLLKPQMTEAAVRNKKIAILGRLTKVLAAAPENGGGTLNVLRNGFADAPARFQAVQYAPSHALNETVNERYGKNRLRVMRQVYYSTRNQKSLDLVFFVNGIPVATAELKTDLTQSIGTALAQYRNDRTPSGEPLLTFSRGALVHFVVSNEEVHMTTALAGKNTYFLPFNAGHNNGAGNAPVEGSSPTSYFWEKILQRDEWLNIVGRFIHFEEERKEDPLTGKPYRDFKIRFPRYHQWRAVSKLAEAASIEGPGHNYLIQHSAGSGKTSTIAWTAHRMASLHRPDGTKVFDGVIVVSDRNVLDGQLQEAVSKLEKTKGVFQAITSGSESSKAMELANALISGKQIIGVTLQTFPYALKKIKESKGLNGRAYAIIADEAHSSQSGKTKEGLTDVLNAGDDIEVVQDIEDVLADNMASRVTNDGGRLSFFAFTATPKTKTLELFGRDKRAFDLYSMRQAIEEKFILDVLKNYVPYKTAMQISRTDFTGEKTKVEKGKASKELMQWVRLHPHSISQRVQIIVEHFKLNVAGHLGGHAKAMVVTASRKEAVRYKQAIDAYIQEKKYTGLSALVAFSGQVHDEVGGVVHTESSMNTLRGAKSLIKAFGTDEHQIMLVANKFQTGFDQPLLVGMYVDKRLSGITAVQTLSRLNRVIPGKDATFIVDFVNDSQTILEAFQEYYEDAEVSTQSDPNIVHDMMSKLDAVGIYDDVEVDKCVAAWHKGKRHNDLFSYLKPAADIFRGRWDAAELNDDSLEVARLEDFRSTAASYVRTYAFFSQIINLRDTRLERLSIYLGLLGRLIKGHTVPTALDLTGVALDHYRLIEREKADMKLEEGVSGQLTGLTAVGGGTAVEKTTVDWQEVIEQINRLFDGTSLGNLDQMNAVSSVMVHAISDSQLQGEAMANNPSDFSSSPSIPSTIEGIVYDAGDGHQQAIKHLLEADNMQPLVNLLIQAGIYDMLRQQAEKKSLEVSE